MAPPVAKLPVSVLNELCQKVRTDIVYPVYSEVPYPHVGNGRQLFKVQVTLGKIIAVGTSNSTKGAKHAAAQSMLREIANYKPHGQLGFKNQNISSEDLIVELHTLFHKFNSQPTIRQLTCKSTIGDENLELSRKSVETAVPVAFTDKPEDSLFSSIEENKNQSALSKATDVKQKILGRPEDPRKLIRTNSRQNRQPAIQLANCKWFPVHQSGISVTPVRWKLIPVEKDSMKTMEMPKLTVNEDFTNDIAIDNSEETGRLNFGPEPSSNVVIELSSDDDAIPPVLRVENPSSPVRPEIILDDDSLPLSMLLSRKRKLSECGQESENLNTEQECSSSNSETRVSVRKMPRGSMESIVDTTNLLTPTSCASPSPTPCSSSHLMNEFPDPSQWNLNNLPSKAQGNREPFDPLPEEVYEGVEAAMAAIFGEDVFEETGKLVTNSLPLDAIQPTTSKNEKVSPSSQVFLVPKPVDMCPQCCSLLSIECVTVNWRTGDFTAFCDHCGSRTVTERAFIHTS